MTLQRCKTEH